MRFAGYVASGWALTALALGAFWARTLQRIRRAERLDSDAR